MSKNAYTIALPQNARAITSVCKLSDSYSFDLDKDLPHPAYRECVALWDTGAVMSVISPKLVQNLGLAPTGYAHMFHANGTSLVNTYFVNLLLPNKLEIQTLQVMEGNMSDTEMLIGMDVIALCDFAISHPDGITMFSFDIPSKHATDYTKE